MPRADLERLAWMVMSNATLALANPGLAAFMTGRRVMVSRAADRSDISPLIIVRATAKQSAESGAGTKADALRELRDAPNLRPLFEERLERFELTGIEFRHAQSE